MFLCQPIALFAPPLRPLRLTLLTVNQLFKTGKQAIDGLNMFKFTPIIILIQAVTSLLKRYPMKQCVF